MKELNWGIISVLILSIFVWYGIFTVGLFTTMMWLIIVSAIIGIILNMKGII